MEVQYDKKRRTYWNKWPLIIKPMKSQKSESVWHPAAALCHPNTSVRDRLLRPIISNMLWCGWRKATRGKKNLTANHSLGSEHERLRLCSTSSIPVNELVTISLWIPLFSFFFFPAPLAAQSTHGQTRFTDALFSVTERIYIEQHAAPLKHTRVKTDSFESFTVTTLRLFILRPSHHAAAHSDAFMKRRLEAKRSGWRRRDLRPFELSGSEGERPLQGGTSSTRRTDSHRGLGPSKGEDLSRLSAAPLSQRVVIISDTSQEIIILSPKDNNRQQ